MSIMRRTRLRPRKEVESVTRRGYRTVHLPARKASQGAVIRMSARRADALEKIISDMTLFDGVKLYDIMESVYVQGRKDGARSVFDAIEDTRKRIPHRSPGRPRKS